MGGWRFTVRMRPTSPGARENNQPPAPRHATPQAVNAHIRTVKIIAEEQVPCNRPSHSEGTTTVRVRLEPWRDE